MVMTIPDLGIQVELSFKAVLSNVLTIYAKVVNPGLSQLCEASIIEIPAVSAIFTLNPLLLAVAKIGLTILIIFF